MKKVTEWEIEIRDALQILQKYAFLLEEWIELYPTKSDITKHQALHRASQINDLLELMCYDFKNDVIYEFIKERNEKATEDVSSASWIDNLLD